MPPNNPSDLSPADRRRQLASILARGVIRWRRRRSWPGSSKLRFLRYAVKLALSFPAKRGSVCLTVPAGSRRGATETNDEAKLRQGGCQPRAGDTRPTPAAVRRGVRRAGSLPPQAVSDPPDRLAAPGERREPPQRAGATAGRGTGQRGGRSRHAAQNRHQASDRDDIGGHRSCKRRRFGPPSSVKTYPPHGPAGAWSRLHWPCSADRNDPWLARRRRCRVRGPCRRSLLRAWPRLLPDRPPIRLRRGARPADRTRMETRRSAQCDCDQRRNHLR